MTGSQTANHATVIEWLLEGDPAIRWQVMRDLLGRPAREWQAERAKVAHEGWGAEILSHQDQAGTWAQALYHRKWTSTHYTLLLLRSMGLDPTNAAARWGAQLLLDGGLQQDGGIQYSQGHKVSETCETGMALAICSYFLPEDERLGRLVDHLGRVQTPDGGWNCRWVGGSKHGSFHTTISVLEGLDEYARLYPEQRSASEELQDGGREFLLDHHLFRSHRTGEVVDGAMTRFSFPPQWHYDVLRGLDHFRAVGAPRDQRLSDGVGLVQKRRLTDGAWKLQNRHSGSTWLEMEKVGQPSRWNTLRALRVLQWWESTAD